MFSLVKDIYLLNLHVVLFSLLRHTKSATSLFDILILKRSCILKFHHGRVPTKIY